MVVTSFIEAGVTSCTSTSQVRRGPLLSGDRRHTAAEGHPGDEHRAGTGQQAHGEQEPGGTSDGVAQRHQQAPVEAAKMTEAGQGAGRRARLRATAVVVDRRPHRGAAGFDQRDQRHQRRQAEADGQDHRVGPPGCREAGGFDAEDPEESRRSDPAEQDAGTRASSVAAAPPPASSPGTGGRCGRSGHRSPS